MEDNSEKHRGDYPSPVRWGPLNYPPEQRRRVYMFKEFVLSTQDRGQDGSDDAY
jgi:hypothetical protein